MWLLQIIHQLILLSQHLAIFPNFLLFLFSNTRSTKLNIFERERPKFNQENFIFDYLSLDWENLIKSDNGNVDQSSVNFFTNSDYIWDMYVPLKTFSKQRLKFRNKLWKTFCIQNRFPLKTIFLLNA